MSGWLVGAGQGGFSRRRAALPLDNNTSEGYNTLAQYVQQMSDSEKLFGAALEAEAPETFSDAICIAEDLDDYELVDSNEGEYGREALHKAGADDEVLDILDSYTDFGLMGQNAMAKDEVLDTGYGLIKRLNSPFPRSGHGAGNVLKLLVLTDFDAPDFRYPRCDGGLRNLSSP